MLPWLSLSTLLALSKVPNYLTGKIAQDERVVFFPTVANKINETHWNIPIHGWIFEPELESKKRKALYKIIGKVFHVNDDQEKKILKQRLMPFAVDNQSWQYVKIKIGANIVPIFPRSSKDGHFKGYLTLREDQLHSKNGIVQFEAVDKDRTFPGEIHLVQQRGYSIVSDIDDTVKHTNYLDKKEFYKNTFVREFQAIPGMAKLYHNFKSQYEDCTFHYVSAAPYQMYEQLQEFFIKNGFPSATFHLKKIRVKDKTLLQLFADPLDYKIGQIEQLLKTFPNRKFILIGDSGEKDPEVYTQLYKKYPSQIENILIRNINNSNSTRMDDLPIEKWQYFNDGEDLY